MITLSVLRRRDLPDVQHRCGVLYADILATMWGWAFYIVYGDEVR
jgi:hypothetical protein